VKYALTNMAGSGWRAECHVTHCLDWVDTPREEYGFWWLRKHMGHHGVHVTMRQATL